MHSSSPLLPLCLPSHCSSVWCTVMARIRAPKRSQVEHGSKRTHVKMKPGLAGYESRYERCLPVILNHFVMAHWCAVNGPLLCHRSLDRESCISSVPCQSSKKWWYTWNILAYHPCALTWKKFTIASVFSGPELLLEVYGLSCWPTEGEAYPTYL